MKDIRKGNDINVAWKIMKDGSPFSLTGKDVRIYLKTPFGKREVKDFSVAGNTISWTFYGKDQNHLGKHSLELVINENKVGMISTDYCDFVNLVSCSCKVGGSDEGNITTESIELTTTLEYVAGEGGGSPYDDTAIWEAVTKLNEDKVDKVEGKQLSSNDYTDEEKEKLSNLENYDDTEIKEELTELSAEVSGLSEGIALRNVGAEDTDESVDEPDLPTPSVSNEWKCIADRRLVEGESEIEFTTYADGTSLLAKELMVQILLDTQASKNLNGYVTIKSTQNKAESMYGTVDYESTSAQTDAPLLNQLHITSSPFFATAKITKRIVASIATTMNMTEQGGSLKNFQIYENIVYVKLKANAPLTSAAPYVKLYAR